MKKCLYCSEPIDTENDDYQKVGKKFVCVFCYEDYVDEIDNIDAEEDGIQSEEED
jgi:hypothetical protein